MLDLLKNIPLIDNICRPHQGREWSMNIDEQRAKAEVYTASLIISLFINNSENLPIATLRYVTLLLGAHPDLNDYALQLTEEGGWLYGYYDKETSAERMSNDIEKHLALTRYLQYMISNYSKNYSGGQHEFCK